MVVEVEVEDNRVVAAAAAVEDSRRPIPAYEVDRLALEARFLV